MAKDAAHDFQGAIFGSIVDDDHAQVGIIGIERALNGAFNDLLFIVGGNEDGDLGAVGGNLGGRAIDVGADAVIDGKDSRPKRGDRSSGYRREKR
jgi:hypothetical protein